MSNHKTSVTMLCLHFFWRVGLWKCRDFEEASWSGCHPSTLAFIETPLFISGFQSQLTCPLSIPLAQPSCE